MDNNYSTRYYYYIIHGVSFAIKFWCVVFVIPIRVTFPDVRRFWPSLASVCVLRLRVEKSDWRLVQKDCSG